MSQFFDPVGGVHELLHEGLRLLPPNGYEGARIVFSQVVVGAAGTHVEENEDWSVGRFPGCTGTAQIS